MRAVGSGGARVAGLGMAKVSHHCLVLACQKLNLASLWVLTARDKEGQVTLTCPYFCPCIAQKSLKICERCRLTCSWSVSSLSPMTAFTAFAKCSSAECPSTNAADQKPKDPSDNSFRFL